MSKEPHNTPTHYGKAILGLPSHKKTKSVQCVIKRKER
jgi:hypothetical protein